MSMKPEGDFVFALQALGPLPSSSHSTRAKAALVMSTRLDDQQMKKAIRARIDAQPTAPALDVRDGKATGLYFEEYSLTGNCSAMCADSAIEESRATARRRAKRKSDENL